MIKYKYSVTGNVRGTVSKHIKLSAAVRAPVKDRRDCHRLGGGSYSDCRVLDLKTGKVVDLAAEGYSV